MSYAPKYIVYKCDICARQTELLLDGNRPDPVRCNITNKCRGKLFRVGERSIREFLFTPIVAGLADFVPRGTVFVKGSPTIVKTPITVFTANGSGVIALSGVRRTIFGGQAQFTVLNDIGNSVIVETQNSSVIDPRLSKIRAVLFEISAELLTANKYIYSMSGAVNIISGPDDSPESKSLRFTSANNITIYANGIELPPSAYNRSIENQITFTPMITDSNNVIEIFVYKDLSTAINNSTQVVLEFKSLVPIVAKDSVLRDLDCWGDYSAVEIDGVERFTLFCTDLTLLNVDKSYGVAYFEATGVDGIAHKLSSSDVFILLGKEPFAFRDKELYAYLSGTSLVELQSVLTYKRSPASGGLLLTVDETSITQVFNPILATRIIESSVAASSIGTTLDGSENLHQKYILGPV